MDLCDEPIDDVLRDMLERSSPPQILVAEDDREMRLLIAASLRMDGYRILEAGTGPDAIRAISKIFSALVPLGLILTDVRMPGWSGLEVLEFVRCIGWKVPIVVMTAFGDEETHVAAKALGALRVLDKPFDIDSLRAAVAGVLRRDAT
jgi:DNA-binding response OmpR family regulator